MKRTLSIGLSGGSSTGVDLPGRLQDVEPLQYLSPFEMRIRTLERTKKQKMGPLGVSAGLSHATIRKWIEASYEPESFNPQWAELKKLADYCGVTVDWLMDTGELAPVPMWAPNQSDLASVRERLLRRSYPRASIDEVLLGSRFYGLRNVQDLFDFCEAQLQEQGLSPRFIVSSAEEGTLGGGIETGKAQALRVTGQVGLIDQAAIRDAGPLVAASTTSKRLKATK